MRLFFLALALSLSIAFAITQGRMQNFSFATYAIKDYQSNWSRPINWATTIADSLFLGIVTNILTINIMNTFLNSGYEPISWHYNHFYNADANIDNFLSQDAKNYNFVFYEGHGAHNLITFWNTNSYIRNTNSGIGVRNTYWAWLSACSVFRNNFSDQDPWFDGVFKGVHSILGLSSIGFGASYVASAYKEFAYRWFGGGEKIWDAYYIPVLLTIHMQGGFDIEPKIVYRYGHINGSFFDPWEEKFLNAYLGPVFYNNDYEGIGSRWITLGNPIY